MNAMAVVIETERRALSALCCERVDSIRRGEILRELENYAWREAEHKVVFDALRRVQNCGGSSLRHELPARATIMGFPDVNWADYLGHGSRCECELLVERLAAELLLAG